jgi:methyl-accepting chemotaxis protein
MPRIEYDELKSLMQSSNHEINSLAEIVDNIKDRLEAIERRQNEILDEIHKIKHSPDRPK